MSEEQIIERIKDLIHTCDVGIEKHGDYDDLFTLDKQALQGLLDLYNKEKETSHYIQSQLDIANAKLIKEKEKNKILLQCLKDNNIKEENEHLFLGNPDM